MNRREILKATMGMVGIGTVGTGLVQANSDQHHWEWKLSDAPNLTSRFWKLYLNGHLVEWFCEDMEQCDADTIEKMKYATQQEVYWRLEKIKIRDGCYPHWFHRS